MKWKRVDKGGTKAPLIPENSPLTGKVRFRCEVCNKIAFATEEHALEAKAKMLKDRGVLMRSYKGKVAGYPCGYWHLSSKSSRK